MADTRLGDAVLCSIVKGMAGGTLGRAADGPRIGSCWPSRLVTPIEADEVSVSGEVPNICIHYRECYDERDTMDSARVTFDALATRWHWNGRVWITDDLRLVISGYRNDCTQGRDMACAPYLVEAELDLNDLWQRKNP